MTEEITNLIVEIGEYVGSITTHGAMRQNCIPWLRVVYFTTNSSLFIPLQMATDAQADYGSR